MRGDQRQATRADSCEGKGWAVIEEERREERREETERGAIKKMRAKQKIERKARQAMKK